MFRAVRFKFAPGEDVPDRNWLLCHARNGKPGGRKRIDIRLSGLYALLRKHGPGSVHGDSENDAATAAEEAERPSIWNDSSDGTSRFQSKAATSGGQLVRGHANYDGLPFTAVLSECFVSR